MRGRTTLAATAAATLLLWLAACGDNSDGGNGDGDGGGIEPVTLRFASMVPQENSFMNTVDWFADELAARSDGAIEVEMFYSESLLTGPEIMPGVRDGVVELGLMAGAYHREEFPLFNAGTLPFLTVNPLAAASANAELYETDDAARDEFDRQGVVPVMWLPASPTVLGTTGPVQTVEDLAGLRVRSVGWLSEALEGAGATPANLAAGEMYEGIQRGVLDGAAAVTFDVYPDLGLHEVAPHVTDTGLGVFNAVVVIANQEALETMSPQVRELVLEVAQEATTEQAASSLAAAEDTACERIRDGGGTVSVMADAEQQRWRQQVEAPIRDRWLDEVTGLGVAEQTAASYLDSLTGLLSALDTDYDNGLQRCAG